MRDERLYGDNTYEEETQNKPKKGLGTGLSMAIGAGLTLATIALCKIAGKAINTKKQANEDCDAYDSEYSDCDVDVKPDDTQD